jgi:hypothetical protein
LKVVLHHCSKTRYAGSIPYCERGGRLSRSVTGAPSKSPRTTWSTHRNAKPSTPARVVRMCARGSKPRTRDER